MTKEYIVPRVEVDESDVGPRPSTNVSLGTIGVVGTFLKGPVNKAVTIGGVEQFIEIFGSFDYRYTGPLSMLGAFNQGASDFEVVRIVGDGASASSVILEDEDGEASLIIEASSPGVWANGAKVVVTENVATSSINVNITGLGKNVLFEGIHLNNVDEYTHTDFKFSKETDAQKLPVASEYTFTGGHDGAVLTDSDYIGTITLSGERTGLKVLEPVFCSIVIAAQQSSAAVLSALLTHVKNAGLDEGLRMAVLNPPKNAAVDVACNSTENFDSARGIMAYPWVEPQEFQGLYVAPDGYYAGLLSQLAAHQSPSNKQINGILSTERLLTMAELKKLTKAKISPITPVKKRGFRVRNGCTLASDTAWDQTSIRRIFDKIEMRVYENTQWAISESHFPGTWENIATQIDSILFEMKLSKEIFDYKPTICNESNNPPEQVMNRILKTRIRVRPLYAADFIDHSIQRLVGNEN